jgi:hypothetical protein
MQQNVLTTNIIYSEQYIKIIEFSTLEYLYFEMNQSQADCKNDILRQHSNINECNIDISALQTISWVSEKQRNHQI